MPGIRSLEDGAFIRAFQSIDRVIQNNQPLFMLVWVGSVLAVMVATVVGVWTQRRCAPSEIVLAALVYLLGVQSPTFMVKCPAEQPASAARRCTMTETARQHARDTFEARLNGWNVVEPVRGLRLCDLDAALLRV